MHTKLDEVTQPQTRQHREHHSPFRPIAEEAAGPAPDRRISARLEEGSAPGDSPSTSRVACHAADLLKVSQDEFHHSDGEVKEAGDLRSGRLTEERDRLLDESAERVLRRLSSSENRSLV